MPKLKVIGHRGARGLAPENTIASLKKALQHRVDEIEFDVRVTSDNVTVLYHNGHLRNTTGGSLSIKKSTFSELKKHKPDLVTLKEALAIVGKTPLYIEVKGGVRVAPVANVLKSHDPKSYRVGSKSQKTLRDLHRLLPEVEKIVIEPLSGIRANWRARQVNAKTISMYQVFLWFGFIKIISKNYELYAYTINNPKKAARWVRWGLSGVVTDFPDRFEKNP